YAALSMACRTGGLGLHGPQNCLLNARYASGAMTYPAGIVVASPGTASAAGFAAYMLVYFYLFFNSMGDLFKIEFHFNTKVGSSCYPASATRSAAKTTKCPAENVTELAENVLHVHAATAEA